MRGVAASLNISAAQEGERERESSNPGESEDGEYSGVYCDVVITARIGGSRYSGMRAAV